MGTVANRTNRIIPALAAGIQHAMRSGTREWLDLGHNAPDDK